MSFFPKINFIKLKAQRSKQAGITIKRETANPNLTSKFMSDHISFTRKPKNSNIKLIIIKSGMQSDTHITDSALKMKPLQVLRIPKAVNKDGGDRLEITFFDKL